MVWTCHPPFFRRAPRCCLWNLRMEGEHWSPEAQSLLEAGIRRNTIEASWLPTDLLALRTLWNRCSWRSVCFSLSSSALAKSGNSALPPLHLSEVWLWVHWASDQMVCYLCSSPQNDPGPAMMDLLASPRPQHLAVHSTRKRKATWED